MAREVSRPRAGETWQHRNGTTVLIAEDVHGQPPWWATVRHPTSSGTGTHSFWMGSAEGWHRLPAEAGE